MHFRVLDYSTKLSTRPQSLMVSTYNQAWNLSYCFSFVQFDAFNDSYYGLLGPSITQSRSRYIMSTNHLDIIVCMYYLS